MVRDFLARHCTFNVAFTLQSSRAFAQSKQFGFRSASFCAFSWPTYTPPRRLLKGGFLKCVEGKGGVVIRAAILLRPHAVVCLPAAGAGHSAVLPAGSDPTPAWPGEPLCRWGITRRAGNMGLAHGNNV